MIIGVPKEIKNKELKRKKNRKEMILFTQNPGECRGKFKQALNLHRLHHHN